MNIHEIDSLLQTGSKVSSMSSKENKDKGFEKIFQTTLSRIDATSPHQPSDARSDILRQGDKILSLLDDYAGHLNDPEKTLRDIEPLVGEIEKEVRFIEAEAAEKGQNDEELQGLINNLVLTANVNIYKFYRGDFA
ncbi:MAG: hypothetical protein U9R17_08060 [Thermodesulfobacteriota bacterium]|nr:hypothetical protein [Thermodesulfobacteriota bacterium]